MLMNRVSASSPLISQVMRSPLRMIMTSLLSRANKGAARNSAPHKAMVLAFIAGSSLLPGNNSLEVLRKGRLDSSTFGTASLADCAPSRRKQHGGGYRTNEAASGLGSRFRHDVAGSGGQAGAFQLHGGVLDAELRCHLLPDCPNDLFALVHVHVRNACVAAERVVASAERPDVHVVDFDNLFQGKNRARHFFHLHFARPSFQQDVGGFTKDANGGIKNQQADRQTQDGVNPMRVGETDDESADDDGNVG